MTDVLGGVVEVIDHDGTTLTFDTSNLGNVERGMALLINQIEMIQSQLGDRNRTTPDGERVHDGDYWEWRRRANYALKAKLAQYRALKARRRELIESARIEDSRASRVNTLARAEALAAVADVSSTDDPDILLRALYGVFAEVVEDSTIVLSPKERATVEVVRAYLNKLSPSRKHFGAG